jgi:hypothetical protein
VCGVHRSGDVTQTGGVYTMQDVLALLKIEAGMGNPTWEQYIIADVNGDGQVTAADAELLLSVIGSSYNW